MHSARAFTLIELLVVIIIIAVTAAILVPAYSRMVDRARFNNDVADVENLFAWAHRNAIALDADVTIQVNPAQGVLTAQLPPPLPVQDIPQALMQQQQIQAESGPQQREALLGNTVEMQAMQQNGSAGAPANSITFHGDGTSDAATLLMQDTRGDSASLHLSPATGQLHKEQTGSEQAAP